MQVTGMLNDMSPNVTDMSQVQARKEATFLHNFLNCIKFSSCVLKEHKTMFLFR